MRDHGLLASLISPENTSTFTRLPTESEEGKSRPQSGSGSVRKIKVEYDTLICDDNGYDEPKGLCDESENDIPDKKYAEYTIDLFHGFDVKLDTEKYRDFCENPLEAFDRYIANIYDAQIAAINKKLLAKMCGLMGDYPLEPGRQSCNDPRTLEVLNADLGANPLFMSLLKATYSKMNRSEMPIIVGEGKLDMYADAREFSSVNNGGIDGSKSRPMRYYRDQDLHQVNPFDDGRDWMLTYLPGTFMFGEWFENVGIYDSQTRDGARMIHAPNEKTTVTIRGIKWDFFRLISECGNYVILRFQKHFDVCPRIPSDAFGDCQPWNYALAYVLGCGNTSCETVNETLVPMPTIVT